MVEPAYRKTCQNGDMHKRVEQARDLLAACNLCPRRCGVNRLDGETGICKTADTAWVSSYNPHFGEEDPLTGRRGSGTIFFTHCNLLCNFCQNYDISHRGSGQPTSAPDLATMMIELQSAGCHNINFVTPSHVVPQILAAVEIAAENGLRVPLVYNSGGYDRVATLKLLDGVVDIYMPDFKFWDPVIAAETCQAEDYPQVARRALLEMHRQVGDLELDDRGIALKGLLVRHLVLPGGLAGTREVMGFIAARISPATYVNIMPQYRPCGRASEIRALSKALDIKDYEAALQAARDEGLNRLDRRRRVFALY